MKETQVFLSTDPSKSNFLSYLEVNLPYKKVHLNNFKLFFCILCTLITVELSSIFSESLPQIFPSFRELLKTKNCG